MSDSEDEPTVITDDDSDDKEDGRKDGSEDDDDPPPLQDCNGPVRWPHGSKGTDSIAAGNANEVGRHVVLPSSHGGGPRDMKQRFADASAVVRKFGKPDLFLTFNCNPTWPEITRELRTPVPSSASSASPTSS